MDMTFDRSALPDDPDTAQVELATEDNDQPEQEEDFTQDSFGPGHDGFSRGRGRGLWRNAGQSDAGFDHEQQDASFNHPDGQQELGMGRGRGRGRGRGGRWDWRGEDVAEGQGEGGDAPAGTPSQKEEQGEQEAQQQGTSSPTAGQPAAPQLQPPHLRQQSKE